MRGAVSSVRRHRCAGRVDQHDDDAIATTRHRDGTARRRDAIAATPSPTARTVCPWDRRKGEKDAAKTHDTNARRARACRLEPAGPCA